MAELPLVFDTITGEFKLLFRDTNGDCALSAVDTEIFCQCEDATCELFQQLEEKIQTTLSALLQQSPWFCNVDALSSIEVDCQ